jgi:hypothetical protein
MAELELSQLRSEPPVVAAATRAVTIALASIGIPLTISRLCCPDANAEMLKASRSAICVGAAQVILEVDVGNGVKGANIVCVTVDVAVVDTVTVIRSVDIPMEGGEEDAGELATNEADEKQTAGETARQGGVDDNMDATGISSELIGSVCVVVPRTSTKDTSATEPIEADTAAKLLLTVSIGAGAASEKDKTHSVRRQASQAIVISKRKWTS